MWGRRTRRVSPAVISRNEKGQQHELSWPELRRQVASLALHLQEAGVKPGDRVAAYLPNIPETMVAFLATVSIGAVWSVCAPDMGTNAVLDRFRQIDPVVLIACDGVTYGGRDFDRLGVVAEMRAALPTLRHVILHRNLGHAGDDKSSDLIADYYPFALGIARNDAKVAAFEPLWLPFDHPLWIVYSSGTTGLPKPIVHGHGGTVIVALALKILHNDVGCSYHPNNWGERYHWYSSTGWVMWNAQTSGLLNGTTCVIFDGNPGGSKEKPDWTTLWRFGAELGVTFFGAGAAFFANCLKAGVDLSTCGDLSKVRALGTTGSPLSPEAQQWGTAQFSCAAIQRKPRPPRGAAPTRSGGAWGRHLVVQHQRRHRLCRRLHRRQPRAAAGAGRDAMPPDGLRGGGLERRRRAGAGRGGRAGLRAADSVDAAVLRGRHEQRAAALQLLRDVPPRPRPQARRG
jgi:acetoacetyl-CoA synthetase